MQNTGSGAQVDGGVDGGTMCQSTVLPTILHPHPSHNNNTPQHILHTHTQHTCAHARTHTIDNPLSWVKLTPVHFSHKTSILSPPTIRTGTQACKHTHMYANANTHTNPHKHMWGCKKMAVAKAVTGGRCIGGGGVLSWRWTALMRAAAMLNFCPK